MTLSIDAVTPVPGSSATAMVWRFKGQLRVSVIVKATFAFADDAVMSLDAPQPILSQDVHHGKSPARSIRFTSDLVPYLSRVDVLFTGHAHAIGGSVVQSLPIRLVVSEGSRVVFDKSLLARDPAGFTQLPLVYERALGGLGSQDNPLGVGDGPGAPNVVDPVNPARFAGLAPIARGWPARRRLLGSTNRAALEGDVAEIPDAFAWEYFQAAPPDQRIDALRGDEWIALEGLHPERTCLRMRLPGAHGAARLYGLSRFGHSEGELLGLRADTLRIDGDEQCCTVVWRGSFEVPSDEALTGARIVAGVATEGQPIVWPEPAFLSRLSRPGTPAAVPRALHTSVGSTALLVDESAARSAVLETMVAVPERAPALAKALPFAAKGGAPPPRPGARLPPSQRDPSGTMELSPEAHPIPRRSLPFSAGAPEVNTSPLPEVKAPPLPEVKAPPLPEVKAPPLPKAPPRKPVWAPQPVAEPAAAAPPPPKPGGPPAPSPALRASLYDKFGDD